METNQSKQKINKENDKEEDKKVPIGCVTGFLVFTP